MRVIKNTLTTFTASFGLSKTGKTVTVSILDDDGNNVATGFSANPVVELGNGTYGVSITFEDNITGYIRWNNTTDSVLLFDAICVFDEFITNISTILTNTNKIPPRIRKNTSLSNFMFLLTDSTTHLPKTGVSVTAQRVIDGGSFASCANAVSEVGNGVYRIDLAASDTNGDSITFRFTGTETDDCLISVITQT